MLVGKNNVLGIKYKDLEDPRKNTFTRSYHTILYPLELLLDKRGILNDMGSQPYSRNACLKGSLSYATKLRARIP